MAILKRIKGSTLMETLVATVLIVVVFMIASMILNQLFSNIINNTTHIIDAHLNELQYLYEHHQIKLPYNDNFEGWEIKIVSFKDVNINTLEIEAINTKTNKTITKTIAILLK